MKSRRSAPLSPHRKGASEEELAQEVAGHLHRAGLYRAAFDALEALYQEGRLYYSSPSVIDATAIVHFDCRSQMDEFERRADYARQKLAAATNPKPQGEVNT